MICLRSYLNLLSLELCPESRTALLDEITIESGGGIDSANVTCKQALVNGNEQRTQEILRLNLHIERKVDCPEGKDRGS